MPEIREYVNLQELLGSIKRTQWQDTINIAKLVAELAKLRRVLSENILSENMLVEADRKELVKFAM